MTTIFLEAAFAYEGQLDWIVDWLFFLYLLLILSVVKQNLKPKKKPEFEWELRDYEKREKFIDVTITFLIISYILIFIKYDVIDVIDGLKKVLNNL